MPLLAAQWRLVRWQFVVLGLLGALSPPYFAASSTRWTWIPEDVAVCPLLLAASLTARLFAREPARPDASYWHALPVSQTRWFTIRIALVVALLATSLAFQWGVWHSPVADWVARLASPGPNQSHMSGLRYVLGADGLIDLGFRSPDVWRTCELALLVVGLTAYFASSFERAIAAWQAGVPGVLVSAFLSKADPIVLHPWLLTTISLVLPVLCLLGTYRLQLRRGLSLSDPHERLLGRTATGSTTLHILIQVLLVSAPVALALAMDPKIEPDPGWTQAQIRWFALALLGSCLLPRTVHEWRVLGRPRWAALGICSLRMSVIGLPVWKALRRQTPTVACDGCGRTRLAQLRCCPECASRRTRSQRSRLREFGRVVGTPWGVLLSTSLGIPMILLLYSFVDAQVGLRSTQVCSWSLQSDMPGVEFARVGTRERAWCIEGSTESAPPSIPSVVGSGMHRGACTIPHSSPFTGSELQELAPHDDDSNAPSLSRVPGEAPDLPVPGDLAFEVLVPGSDVRIASFQTDVTWRGSHTITVTRLGLDLPQHVGRAKHLIEYALAGTLGEPELSDLASQGDAQLTVLVREMGLRVPNRMNSSAYLTAEGASQRHEVAQLLYMTLDRVFAARYAGRLERPSPRELAMLLDEIETLRERHSSGGNGALGPPFDLTCIYGPLWRLQRCADVEQLSDAIAAGNPYASVAAGMRGEQGCYEACLHAFRLALCQVDAEFQAGSEWTDRLRCSAWALTRIDPQRGALDVVDSLLELPESHSWGQGFVLGVLTYSGRPEIEMRVRMFKARLSPRAASTLDLDVWSRCFSGLHAGLQPKEYWLGW